MNKQPYVSQLIKLHSFRAKLKATPKSVRSVTHYQKLAAYTNSRNLALISGTSCCSIMYLEDNSWCRKQTWLKLM